MVKSLTLGTLAVLVLTGGCDQQVSTKDVPPIPVSEGLAIAPDLTLKPQRGNDQALAQIQQLVGSVPKSIAEIVQKNPDEWVAGDKANLVASGEPLLNDIEKIVAEPWVLPTPQYDKEEPQLFDIKSAARILCAYAKAVDEGGNPELAVRALLAVRNLSSRLFESSTGLVPYLIAIAIDAIVEKDLRQIVVKQSMSEQEMTLLQGKGYSPYNSMTGLSTAVKGEWTHYFVPAIAQIEFVPKGVEMNPMIGLSSAEVRAWSEGNPNPFDRKQTLTTYAGYFRALISDIEKHDPLLTDSKEAYAAITQPIPASKQETIDWAQKTPNSVGLLLGRLMVHTEQQAYEAALKCEIMRGLSEVVVAAQKGLQATGNLPMDMGELRKFGLPKHSIDLYSGTDFGYDSVRGVAWSVGPDRKDDGGKDKPEVLREVKDWVVAVK